MDAKHIHEILGERILVDKEAIVIDQQASQGSYLVDAVTNKTYLDCFSQFASQPLGWNPVSASARQGIEPRAVVLRRAAQVH